MREDIKKANDHADAILDKVRELNLKELEALQFVLFAMKMPHDVIEIINPDRYDHTIQALIKVKFEAMEHLVRARKLCEKIAEIERKIARDKLASGGLDNFFRRK